MNGCLSAAERPGDWERCSAPVNIPPSPYLSTCQQLPLQLCSQKSLIHRQITFSAALPSSLCLLCCFFLLSHSLQTAVTKDLWRTFLSSPSTRIPNSNLTSSTLGCSFIYLKSIEQHKGRCLVTAPVSTGVPPEGKPVSMTWEPPEEYRARTERGLNLLLIGHHCRSDVFTPHQPPLPLSLTASQDFGG